MQLKNKTRILSLILSVLVPVFLVCAVAYASITISGTTITLSNNETIDNSTDGTVQVLSGVLKHAYDSAAYWTATQADTGAVTFDSVSDGTPGFTFSDRISFGEVATVANRGEGTYILVNEKAIGLTTPADVSGVKLEFDYDATPTLAGDGKMAHGLDVKMIMDKDYDFTTKDYNGTVRGARIQAYSYDDISGRLEGLLANAQAQGTGKTIEGHWAQASDSPGIVGVAVRTELATGATITSPAAAGIVIYHQNKGTAVLTGDYRAIQIENSAPGGGISGTETGIYFGNQFLGSSTFDYGIDMDAVTFGTADIRFSNGTTLASNTDGGGLTLSNSTTSSDPKQQMYLTRTHTGALGDGKGLTGVEVRSTFNGTANAASSEVKGGEFKARHTDANTYNVGTMKGVIGNVDSKTGAKTITSAWAVEGQIDCGVSSTITTAAGVRVAYNEDGTVTNAYGVYVDGTSVWDVGVKITDSKTVTGIDVGTATTGLLISGATTNAISITGVASTAAMAISSATGGKMTMTTTAETATDPGRQLYLQRTHTGALGAGKGLTGVEVRSTFNGSADALTSEVKGGEFKARHTEGNTYDVGTFKGVIGNVDAKNGTVTNAWAVEGAIDVEAGGTITTAAGLHINVNNSGTITNDYGIYIDVPNAAADDLTADIYKNANGHLNIKTNPAYPARNVRINSQTYTTDASIIGLQVKPRGGVNLTNRIAGIEVSPGINDTFTGTDVSGIISNPLLKGTTGNLSGEMRAFEGKVESDTGSTRTVTGPVSILKADQAMHGTVTNGVFVIDVDAAGGNVAWSGLANLPDDAQIAHVGATMTLSPETNAESGFIRIEIGGTTYQIPFYAE